MRSASLLAVLVVVQPAWLALSAVTEQPLLRVPDAEHPAILDVVDALDGLTAFAVGPAGNSAAVARARTGNQKAEIRLYAATASQPMSVTVAGEVRDLLFTGDGRLYGLLHKPAKKGQGETRLISIETGRPKVHHLMRMPPTARALDSWIRQDAVIIACRDELRTVLVPDIRSGPLYRVPGDNRAVAVLGAGNGALIAQRRELLRVNLADLPQEYELPVRERAATPEPIESLAGSRDGRRAMALAVSGRVYAVDFEPLVVRPEGSSAVGLAALPRSADPEAGTSPEAVAGDAGQSDLPDRTAAMEPTVDEISASADVEIPSGSATGNAAGSDAATAIAGSPQPPETTRSAEISDVGPEVQIWGRISGPAVAQVDAVMVMGPDNLLIEATRVRPATDGTWSVSALDPGRYRVQLAAADGRVLVTDPPFLWLEVEAGGRIHAPDIRVLRKL